MFLWLQTREVIRLQLKGNTNAQRHDNKCNIKKKKREGIAQCQRQQGEQALTNHLAKVERESKRRGGMINICFSPVPELAFFFGMTSVETDEEKSF